MRLVKTLVWTVLSYGAEAWTLKVRDERKITSMEIWIWRRMMRISWMEKRTDNTILQELDIKSELSYSSRRVRGRKTKTREATETIHRQPQTMDTINNITVRKGCRRSQPMETTRQSSDGGRRSHMICRKEEDNKPQWPSALSFRHPPSIVVLCQSQQ